MSATSEHHDYITGSVAGVMTLVIVAAGLLLVAVYFYAY